MNRAGIFVAGTTAGTFPGFSQGFTDPFVVKLMNPVSIGFGTGGTDDHISLKRRQVQVTIFSTADFDVIRIQSASRRLNPPVGTAPRVTVAGHPQDVNLDGRTDMLLRFDLVEINIDGSAMQACVVGHTRAEIPLVPRNSGQMTRDR
jgi:hypothetical protein